jgi:hypothetical protein
VVVVLAAGCGGQAYNSARGARVVHYTLRSRYVGEALHEIKVIPRQHGKWLLALLHGKGAGPSQFLSQPFFDTLAALGKRAPIVLLLDGGDDSYWHDRADGKWESMLLNEALPSKGAIAIGGISMGGYGAVLASSRSPRFCATAVMSPALWTSAGTTAPGAFDDAQDYALNDVFKLPTPRPLWIALGASDPFYDATLAYARRAGVTPDVGPGGHDSTFWDGHIGALLRFAARACVR